MSAIALLLAVLALTSCASRSLTPASVLDTAQNNYRAGLTRLDAGDLAGAQRAFDRAIALDPSYANAYAGSALIAMAQKEYAVGHERIQEALRSDRSCVDAYLALGRLIAAEGEDSRQKPETWLPEACGALKRAAKIAPGDPRVPYYEGVVFEQALHLDEARRAFKRAMELGGSPWDARAARALALLQKAERAAPGSVLGQRIALQPEITRAELSVLLIDELRLRDLMRRRPVRLSRPGGSSRFIPPSTAPSEARTVPEDVRDTWAQPWIEEVLELGFPGLECFPDGSFQPDAGVTRADYARVVEELLVVITGDTGLRTRYVGGSSRFPDVRSDHYAYNAIALVTERGLMSVDPLSGAFRPEDPVSGAEALSLIRDLQHESLMEF